MGGSNPIKKIVDEVTTGTVELGTGIIREGARAVGADGIVDGAEKLKEETRKGAAGLSDMATGEDKKQAAAAKIKADQQAAVDNANAEAEKKKQNDAAFAASEEKRMAAGSKSRTLLTGPKGLEDEDGVTMSRRTLTAR